MDPILFGDKLSQAIVVHCPYDIWYCPMSHKLFERYVSVRTTSISTTYDVIYITDCLVYRNKHWFDFQEIASNIASWFIRSSMYDSQTKLLGIMIDASLILTSKTGHHDLEFAYMSRPLQLIEP